MLSRLDPATRRLLVRVPVAAGVSLFIWYAAAAEIFSRGLSSVTEGALRLFESPAVTMLTYEGGTIIVRRSDFPASSQLPVFNPASFTGNYVFFLALYLSTPGAGLRERMLAGLLASLVLFATHVLHFGLAIETLYATQLGAWSLYAYPRWQREIFASGRYFFDIALKYALPFVVWGFLILLPELQRRDDEETDKEARRAEGREQRKKKRKRA